MFRIKNQMLTYHTRITKDAFRTWKKQTEFRQDQYKVITSDSTLINKRDKIETLKELLIAKQK